MKTAAITQVSPPKTQLPLLLSDSDEAIVAKASKSSVMRPIHYLGSKLRLIEPIQRAIDSVSPRESAVCDLFSGSGTVSYALSQSRQVLAVDIQEYSRVLCNALLNPRPLTGQIISKFFKNVHHSILYGQLSWAIEPMIEYEEACLASAIRGNPHSLCELLEAGSILALERSNVLEVSRPLKLALTGTLARLASSGFIGDVNALAVRHFGGLYFSYRQSAQIDCLLHSIEQYPEYKETLLAALLSTVSDVVNTVGKQFAQPIRPRSSSGEPKRHLISQIHRDRSEDVLSRYVEWLRRYAELPAAKFQHKAIRGDYHEVLRSLDPSFSVIYADPPYTRDHYSRYYHVLETLCLRDNPEVSTVKVDQKLRLSRGVYRIQRHQSPFCIKSEAPGAFATLFEDVRRLQVPLVLSYSPYAKDRNARPRLMTVDALVTLAKGYFRKVDCRSAGKITHNKLNTTELNFEVSHEAEVLITCCP